MVVKSKVKPKIKVKAKVAVKSVTTKKLASKPKPMAKAKSAVKAPVRVLSKTGGSSAPITNVIKRIVNPLVERRPVMPRTPRVHQFAYMKAPGSEHAFEVGDTVEVFCDHEKNKERIRGWVKGIVVQVDNKMVAVQFRSNVFLTDGWMVPDRILWYPLTSEHIRPMPGKKPVKREIIPDY